MTDPGPAAPSTARGDAKRDAITRAALEVFLAAGFVGASVDDIAAAAHVSKRTLYAHFGDKERLFHEVVRGTIEPMQARLEAQLAAPASADPREAVRELTAGLARIIVTPQVVRLRRMIAAEADRFPGLARAWFDLGPAQTVVRLAQHVERLARDGVLDVRDPAQAAEHLLWLAISAPLNRLLFLPSGTTVDDAELERTIESAFEVFWRAYGAPHHPST